LKSHEIPLRPPFSKGEKEGSFSEGIPKSSPPFEKGRTGGISEPIFQKTKLVQIFPLPLAEEGYGERFIFGISFVNLNSYYIFIYVLLFVFLKPGVCDQMVDG